MLVPFLLLGLLASHVSGLGQNTCVTFQSSASTFTVASNGKAAPLILSADDWPGVQRAAQDFAADIQRVTGIKPTIANASSSTPSRSSLPIIIGTLGKSSLINKIVNTTKLDVSGIENKWEAFQAQVVANPLPGISKAYVIIGADKRGTIFAMYDHSEQFGVSPWYWWADVPTTQHSALFVTPSGCSHGSPSVQYRGIFLNDEAPALTNWALEKFTNGTGAPLTGSPFNHAFYTKLFELMLRIKANYLWPAQWNSAFALDDSVNFFFADMYGIVMGTSHQEPLMRSIPTEWTLFGEGAYNYGLNADFLHDFWTNSTIRASKYENLWTIGLRGNGDLPAENTGIELLTKVIEDQRGILSSVLNVTDVSAVPQLWALYKEVEAYYIDGMRVEDDITLLWTDDNWGNIRRFPLPEERNRTGGAGVYYHVDYVGDPMDYKWITTSQIPKIYEQLSIAIDRNATRVWVVNVGDLKPCERETEFFIAYGWNATRWQPDNLDTYLSSWAKREFGLSDKDANIVSDVVANLTRFNARRKPELLNSTTYSLINYRESENVLAAWDHLQESSTAIYNKLPAATKPAFFQLVQHPVLASANLGHMLIAAGQSILRASQARLSANDFADQVETLFENDFALESQYHELLDGKWDHMMDQTHLGYAYWQQPMTNSMPPISRVQKNKQALPGVMRISPEGSLASWPGDNQFQCAQMFSCPPPTLFIDQFDPIPNRFIDIGAGGPTPFTFTASVNVSWLTLSPSHGSVSPKNKEQRVVASVDWSELTDGLNAAEITFTALSGNSPVNETYSTSIYSTFIVANKTSVPSTFKGFVEGGGAVAFEAEHATRNNSVAGMTWKILPGVGRTLSGVTPWPRLGNNEQNFTAGTGPSLEYDFFTFNGGHITVTTLVSPSGNGLGRDRPVGFATQVDSAPVQSSYFYPLGVPGQQPPEWNGHDGFVANSIISAKTAFTIAPGAHTLKLFMIEPAVVVQKIVINTGGVKPSYLGPQESILIK
ncbi:hypothetical protein DFH09DRAFT_478550 [Mycena vulgaris]|nr:hypothetical protein DFH09DRAFT_478550 [Mycena vulgaris]